MSGGAYIGVEVCAGPRRVFLHGSQLHQAGGVLFGHTIFGLFVYLFELRKI